MRPLLLTILLSPLLRCPATVHASRKALLPGIPAIEYPICRRNFTCSAPTKQDFKTIMTDLGKEEMAAVEKLADPAECEKEILTENKGREEALKDVAEEPSKEEKEEEQKLPKLSAAEFQVYNSMAEGMEYYHNHFRQSWTTLHTACVNNRRPSNLSLKQFISTGLQLCSHLSAHHSIEEQHIFPLLAAKMPEFKQGRNAAELLRQHREIHAGMDVFEDYLKRCRSGETELELRVMKEKMDSWGEVLWKHLDQEVKTLGADNMRRYWTLEEMRRMPM